MNYANEQETMKLGEEWKHKYSKRAGLRPILGASLAIRKFVKALFDL